MIDPSDNPQRMSALMKAYESAQARLMGLPFEDFVEAVEAWDVYPVWYNWELCGAVLMKGPEIHACIAEGFGHWLTKKILRDTLGKIIHQYGYAQTSATTPAGVAFVQRLGFYPTEDGHWVKVKNGH